jgi:hypothetical protein
MRLFRNGERTELGPISSDQTAFDWLDNSAKPDADHARENLQCLFDQLPATSKPSFAWRLHQNGPDHHAAVAEIYAHEVFRQSGYNITHEPTTTRGSRPEFLIESSGFQAYVEVTVDMGAAVDQKEDKAVYDLIESVSERVNTLGFGILVNELVKGTGNPAPKRFAKFLDEWFKGFDHSTERTKLSGLNGDFTAMPRTTYSEGETGWRIEMTLWPLEAPDKRLNRIAGSTGTRVKWCNSQGRLADKIHKKLHQHAGCCLPIIVCVAQNDLETEPDQEDVVDVLLGKSHWSVNFQSDDPPVHGRNPDGVWSRKENGRGLRPAGLMLTRRVYPWSLMKVEPELWDNPNIPASELLPVWHFKRWRWDVPGTGELKLLWDADKGPRAISNRP